MKKIFNRAEVLEIINSGCVKAILDYDLQGVDLHGVDLHGVDLHNANLQYADLHNANLQYADLQGADLHGAYLQYADLNGAYLQYADLQGANLNGAYLQYANLQGANLDFSCLPLRCGGLKWKIDKRIACQLAYHFCSMKCDDEEFIKVRNSMLDFANQFHRVEECRKLEKIKEVVNEK